MISDPVVLGLHEDVAGRAFTAVDLLDRDRAILADILADVIGILADVDAGKRQITPYQPIVWRAKRRTRRTLICDEARLRAHPRLCVVGFFGERNPDLDADPLEEANTAIVAAFPEHRGILSYSSIELGVGRWANLVLHEDPADREHWRQNRLHADAVRVLSPVHYENVRIHNAELSGPILESPGIVLLRTKYFDYSGPTLWRAERPAGQPHQPAH